MTSITFEIACKIYPSADGKFPTAMPFRDQDKLFESAFQYAAIGMALVRTDGHFLRVNRSLCELSGYPEDELLRLSFQDITHPDDLNADLSLLQQLIQGEIETYRMEKRYFHRDGRTIWIQLSVSAVRDGASKIQFFVSQIKDISERKESETALLTITARLTTLIINLQAAILVEDENRHVVLVNQAFCEMFEISLAPEQLIGTDCTSVLENISRCFRDPQSFSARVYEILENRQNVVGEELHLKDGRYLERDYIPIFSRDNYLGHLWSCRDITESRLTQQQLARQTEQLKQVNELLQHQALTDSLTGLANRRALHQQLSHEWKRAVRNGDGLSLVMMDLDFFKKYNDTFGHQAGDAVLQQTGALLRFQTRGHDFVARYGGEEIAIILPATSLEGALILTERFREAVENAQWPRAPITASFGVACVAPRETLDAEAGMDDLIARADAALYQAKAEGRNRVCAGSA